MEHVINVLKGAVIGIANAIPGVSGGTMMVIMKVFDRLMDAVSFDLKKLKKNFVFLLTIGLGLGIGVIVTAKVLTRLFDSYYVKTQFFFMGVVIGSLPMIYKEANAQGKLKPIHILPFIIGLIVILAISMVNSDVTGVAQTQLTTGLVIKLLVVSIIAAIAMVMPGISGSLIFLILGVYQTIIQAVDEMNIPILIPVAIGVIIGVIICAKIMSICMKKFYKVTYSIILGLIFGSLYAIFPKDFSGETAGSIVVAIIMMMFGIALPILMELPSLKKEKAGQKA